MRSFTDPVFALLFAMALTFADRLFVSGPYMGFAGMLLSLAASLLGWYAARAGASLLPRTAPSGPGGYSTTPVIAFSLFAALIFAAVAYVKIFDMTKVDYTSSDVIYHLLLIVLAAFTIRMAANSVEAMR
jgi:hypothetical protein